MTRTNLPEGAPWDLAAPSTPRCRAGGCHVPPAPASHGEKHRETSRHPHAGSGLVSLSARAEVKRDIEMKSAVRQRHGDTAAPGAPPAPAPRRPHALPAPHLARCVAAAPRRGPLCAARGTAARTGGPLARGPGVRLSCGSSGAARAAGGSRLAGRLGRSCTRHKCRHREKRLLCVSVSSTLLFFFPPFPFPSSFYIYSFP